MANEPPMVDIINEYFLFLNKSELLF